MDGNLNQSGVALALALAKYFKRWSLWSKDIIILITGDSRAGPQAWVDAYHDEHTPPFVAPLALKSGALQGVVVVDNALDHRFESLHIVYDGINGQLPNLDLFNTAVSIASGQLGIGVSLQRMWKHNDSYQERLQTMLRGMVSQGLGYSSGPHSSFVPYHVDAITLQAVGDGWQDEMAMGRCVESIFRSLNNLLEHFHQSFFFYLLMQADRFVSIGTYLPSAMLVAVNFTIMAIALWIRSGRPPAPKVASTMPEKQNPEMEIVQENNMTAITPKENPTILERQLFLPVTLVVSLHFLGVIPLYVFINSSHNVSPDSPSSSSARLMLCSDSPFVLPPLHFSQFSPTHCPGDLHPPSHPFDTTTSSTPPVILTTYFRHIPRHACNIELLALTVRWAPVDAFEFHREPFFILR